MHSGQHVGKLRCLQGQGARVMSQFCKAKRFPVQHPATALHAAVTTWHTATATTVLASRLSHKKKKHSSSVSYWSHFDMRPQSVHAAGLPCFKRISSHPSQPWCWTLATWITGALCPFNDAPQATLPAIDSSGRSPGCLVLELLERCESDVVRYRNGIV